MSEQEVRLRIKCRRCRGNTTVFAKPNELEAAAAARIGWKVEPSAESDVPAYLCWACQDELKREGLKKTGAPYAPREER